MSDKRVSCKPEDLCDALFWHLAGNLQSMLPVVKLQVFFGIQTLYTVGKSGILNKVCTKLFLQCGRQIILRHRQTDAEKRNSDDRSSRTVKLVEMALFVAIILIWLLPHLVILRHLAWKLH